MMLLIKQHAGCVRIFCPYTVYINIYCADEGESGVLYVTRVTLRLISVQLMEYARQSETRVTRTIGNQIAVGSLAVL